MCVSPTKPRPASRGKPGDFVSNVEFQGRTVSLTNITVFLQSGRACPRRRPEEYDRA